MCSGQDTSHVCIQITIILGYFTLKYISPLIQVRRLIKSIVPEILATGLPVIDFLSGLGFSVTSVNSVEINNHTRTTYSVTQKY